MCSLVRERRLLEDAVLAARAEARAAAIEEAARRCEAGLEGETLHGPAYAKAVRALLEPAMTELIAGRLFDRIGPSLLRGWPPRYAVNIGCADGKEYSDPVYPLYQRGFRGCAIDANNDPKLAENLGSFPVALRPGTPVSPANIVSVLREAGCPTHPHFLKIDIDGMDGPVLRAIMEGGFRPLVIQMEVNPEIPPPLAFSVGDHPDFRAGGHTGFFGCSLAYAADLLGAHAYDLVEIDFSTQFTHDALFVDRVVLDWGVGVSKADPRTAFLAAQPIVPHFAAPVEQKLAWREVTDYDRLCAELRPVIVAANEAKHGDRRVPFELFVAGTPRQ